jgi:type III pantothenate kinase
MKDRPLLIDIGNTSTTVALGGEEEITHLCRYPRANGVEDNVAAAVEEYREAGVTAVVVGSVVPELTPWWREVLAGRLGVPHWELKPGQPLSISVDYPDPTRIGADRLANAVAAVHYVGAPVVVADFGTALTFDIVTADRGYVGGVIAPGIGLMYSYFAEKTALLPKLTPAPCDRIIGRSTEEAMHAGAYFGYRGMVREIFHEIRRDLGVDSLSLLATGGFASRVLHPFEESVMIRPLLTLEGLALAWGHAQSATDT